MRYLLTSSVTIFLAAPAVSDVAVVSRQKHSVRPKKYLSGNLLAALMRVLRMPSLSIRN